MNIALIGYGKMGKEVERIASERNVVIKQKFTSMNNLDGIGLTKESLLGIDVCIDFSTPLAVINNIGAVASCGKNIIVGTTGWLDKLDHVKEIVRAKRIGLLYSPNFLLGMNIFSHLVAAAASHMNRFGAYDVSIYEAHHKEKTDSPSGTALMLGEAILQHFSSKRELLHGKSFTNLKPEQLQITSERVGDVVGSHTVLFDSEADVIELRHTAKNRSGFALGALIAAEWLKGKQGIFTMNDVMTSS